MEKIDNKFNLVLIIRSDPAIPYTNVFLNFHGNSESPITRAVNMVSVKLLIGGWFSHVPFFR